MAAISILLLTEAQRRLVFVKSPTMIFQPFSFAIAWYNCQTNRTGMEDLVC